MSDIACPKCKGTTFRAIAPRWVYRRDWRGRWRKVHLSDVAGCEACKRIYEIAESGAVTMLEDVHKPNPEPSEEEGKPDLTPRHALADAIRRPEV